MTLKIAYDIINPTLGRKIRSEIHLLSLPYINRSMTKYFLIERIRERTDSSIKNLGGVEYDKQNWLKAELRFM